MDSLSSPDSTAAAVDGVAASPPRSTTSGHSASSPSVSTPRRRLLVDDDNGNGNGNDNDSSYGHRGVEAIPATPVHPTQEYEAGVPSTPLSPLVGLMDGMDDDNDADDDDAPSEDDERDEGPPVVAPTAEYNDHDDALDEEDTDVLVTARGTDVNVRVAAATFREFLRTFYSLKASDRQTATSTKDSNNDEDDNNDGSGSGSDDDSILNQVEGSDDEDDQANSDATPFYLKQLETILQQSTPTSLDIDTMHLFYHNEESQKLYHQLVHYPMELVPLMDIVVKREVRRLLDADQNTPVPDIQIRPYNLKEVSNLRCLDPIAMDSLVCLKGMIVRTSPIIPDLKVAHFSCVICGNDQQRTIDRGRIDEPTQCPSCNTKNTFQLVHNRSVFSDKQLVRVQETPDQVPAGQTPASLVTFCFDTLVDKCQPGDKVEVTGVLRAQPVRVNPKISKLKSIYKTYVDVIHFRPITGMERDQQGDTLTSERIAHLKQLAAQPDIYEQLTKSLAPSIWELDNVKKGVLTMLFGGNHKRVKKRVGEDDDEDLAQENDQDDDTPDPSRDTKLNKRGDINILLCGDPGTSKSQLLSYVHKLSSRGIYTSGKGSSAVGLTASVVRDPETRDLVLESGALVLSDRGICCIDEFDKMSDATRSILHEAMEQQTVSIAKAGIIASLNARTSILASANPLESRYNPNLSVVENIKLPPTLLSRFDLIFLILDSPNADQDRKLAQHLVGLYYDIPDVVEPPMDTDLLRDYIDYARKHVHPFLTDEAAHQLLESYLELRNPPGSSGNNNGNRTISATPRQLESLVRTSEALAKMRYSNEVTRADAQEAVRLLKVATQAAATDPRTGKIDMDMITTGRSTVDREQGEQLYTAVKDLLAERRGNRLAIRDISKQLSEVSNTTIPQDDLVSALRRLEADGVVQFNERNQSLFVRSGIVS